MRHTYCGEACQRNHYAQHVKSCVPFYFIAGGSSEEDRKKRPREQGKEQEQEAESAYVRLYAAYKRSKDETLVPQLEEYFGRMSEEARRKYVDGLPCHTDRDPISLEDIHTLEADNVVYLMEGNIKYCYELDALVGYLHSASQRDNTYGRRDPVHPVTRQPFTTEEINRIDDAAKTRLVTLWSKFRTFTDVPLLSEVVEKLGVMYAAYVSADILTGAKHTRLEKELKEVHAKGLCSYVVAQWPLLSLLDGKVEDIEWEHIKNDIPGTLFNMFKTKAEWLNALEVYEFYAFCKSDNALGTALLKKFYPNEKVGSKPFKSFKKKLYTDGAKYELVIDDTVLSVVVGDGESVRNAYERVFNNYDGFENLPPNQDRINHTWLLITAAWETDEGGRDWESDYEWGLVWPGDPIINNDTRTARLTVTIEYEPPTIYVVFDFPTRLKHIEPATTTLDPHRIYDERNVFVANFTPQWPTQWGITNTADYHTKIVYELSSSDRHKTVLENINDTPYGSMYDSLSEFVSDNNLAGPSVGGQVTWTVSISVVPNMEAAYKKGAAFFASKWRYYKDTLGLTYEHIKWSRFTDEWKDSEAELFMVFFDTIDDLELASRYKAFKRAFGTIESDLFRESFWKIAYKKFVSQRLPDQKAVWMESMKRALQQAKEKRKRLKRFRKTTFILTMGVLSYTSRYYTPTSYNVVADTPDRLEEAYKSTYEQNVMSLMPAHYRPNWIQIRSEWAYDNSSLALENSGSLAFSRVWPGPPSEPWANTVRLTVSFITGPLVVLGVQKVGAFEVESKSLNGIDVASLGDMSAAERENFMGRLRNMWISAEEMALIEHPEQWETFVHFEARVGFQSRSRLLPDNMREGLVIRNINEVPFEKALNLLKDAMIKNYTPENDARQVTYGVTIEARRRNQ